MPGDQQGAVLDVAEETWDPARTRSILVEAAVVSWGLFALVTVVVSVWPDFWLDRQVREWIDSELLTRGPVSYVLAHLGAAPLVTPFVVLACAYFVLRWRSVLPAVILAASYALVGVVVTIFKELLRRPEPRKAAGALGYSYPSGHAGAATVGWFGFALTWWLLNRMAGSRGRHRVPYVAAGAVVGAVWLMMLLRSAHWMTDMVGGVVLGGACICTIGAIVLTEPVSRFILRLTPRPFRTPIRRPR